MDAGTALYAKQGTTYVLKFVGEIRYTMGCSLEAFLDQLFAQHDYDDILIDLTDATTIDSTCLGLLAKIANVVKSRFGRKTTLVSSNEDINQILDGVGFAAVFNICNDREATVAAYRQLPSLDPDKARLTKILFEAHQILSELNEDNRHKFKSVIEVLKNEVGGSDKASSYGQNNR